MIYLEVKAPNQFSATKNGTLICSRCNKEDTVANLKNHVKDALLDGDRYIDVFPMNYTDDGAIHNDNLRHGTMPDFYDIMVRGGELSEDALYCEVEYLTSDQVTEVEFMLEEVYEL